jgi:hypothetical protein
VEKPGLTSYLFTALFLLVAVGLFFAFDVWISNGASFSFIQYSGLNLLLAAFLSAFDALFIDYFILLVWRPSFLAGKEEFPARERMLRHIKLQFSYGWIYKVALALIAAGLAVVFL